MRKGLSLVALGLLFAFSGCSQRSALPEDPKRLLGDYVSKSFAVDDIRDRQELSAYLTGDAKNRLASWSDEQFRQAFIVTKRELLKLLVTEIKKVSDREVSITYELTYLDKTKGRNTKVTNKKLCQVVKEQGKWLISDVRSIKELVEYQNEMSLPVE